MVAYGFVLIIIMIFLRGGIMGGARMLWLRFGGKGGR
jgi:hypothetical protein